MPKCAAFVDDLRQAFGVDEINNVIRRGLRPEAAPEHQVHFGEAGHELGSASPIDALGVTPMLPLSPAAPVRGRR